MAEDGRFKGVKGSGGYGWLVRLEQPEGSPGANLDWASEATSFLTYWLQFKDGDGVPCRFRAQIITGRAQRYMGTFTVVTVKTSDGSPVDGLDL